MERDQRRRGRRAQRAATIAVLLGLLVLGALAPATSAPSASPERLRVLVVSVDGSDPGAEVGAAGGTVVRSMSALGTVVADVDAAGVAALGRSVRIRSVTPDRSVRLAQAAEEQGVDVDEADEDGTDDGDAKGRPVTSLGDVAEVIDAPEAWARGATGAGVDVALIDSGVAKRKELKGRVVDGPDLSFDSQRKKGGDRRAKLRDGFGHGTHMAGIIAGATSPKTGFTGVAPHSRLVNVKVADHDGAADVSQVIAAIDWVVANRRTGGLDIRVLNLSFGTDSVQDYRLDPLAHAAEAAWHHGIVVVTSAGNSGERGLTNPAFDPFVLAVGATDTSGTTAQHDDAVAAFSSRGDGRRNPDLAAPGVSVASLRAPRSAIDEANPEARHQKRYFRGTGTSQSAAVVSGAAAALLSAHPALTPDQVKAALVAGATPLDGASVADAGAGTVDVDGALDAVGTAAVAAAGRTGQAHERSSGTGSLDAARGSARLVDEATGAALEGEVDIFGQPFDSVRWSAESTAGTAWSGGMWNSVRWAGDGWCSGGWTGVRWSSVRWNQASWAGVDWDSVRWNGVRWASVRWNGERWESVRWHSVRWNGVRWSSVRWQ